MVNYSKMGVEEANKVAIACLHFVAGNPEHLGGFLATTGLGPDNLRAAARDSRFLGAILTYISDDECLLLDCAESTGTAPQAIAKAYETLVGTIEPDMI